MSVLNREVLLFRWVVGSGLGPNVSTGLTFGTERRETMEASGKFVNEALRLTRLGATVTIPQLAEENSGRKVVRVELPPEVRPDSATTEVWQQAHRLTAIVTVPVHGDEARRLARLVLPRNAVSVPGLETFRSESRVTFGEFSATFELYGAEVTRMVAQLRKRNARNTSEEDQPRPEAITTLSRVDHGAPHGTLGKFSEPTRRRHPARNGGPKPTPTGHSLLPTRPTHHPSRYAPPAR
ncbi:MAG: hypothetical protein IT290_06605 [Deltaproteobacteria bacterium]|nr:hypothetical protein [Deltaproteobacteria bacterium]